MESQGANYEQKGVGKKNVKTINIEGDYRVLKKSSLAQGVEKSTYYLYYITS